MRVFKNFDPSPTPAKQNAEKSSSSKARTNMPQRPRLSQSEVRAKVQEHMAKKQAEADKAKAELSKKSQYLAQQNESKAKPGANAAAAKKEDEPIIGDVGKNDPNDSNTQEKLKSILGSGGFSFNPNEREVLSKILGN